MPAPDAVAVLAVVEFVAGAVVVGCVLYDVFQGVVVPRWTSRTLRISPLLTGGLWPLWRRLGVSLKSAQRREDFLGTYAPLVVMALLVMWVLSLIFGYG